MSVELDAGQMVFGGGFPPNTKGLPTEGAVEAALSAGTLGGVLVFPWNFVSAMQNGVVDVKLLADKMARYLTLGGRSLPVPFLAIDQEGGGTGGVQRLAKGTMYNSKNVGVDVTTVPTAGNIGARHSGETEAKELARQIGDLLASELRLFGFNLDFAPVADLAGPRSFLTIKGHRAFHEDATRVGVMAKAMCEAMTLQHVIPCGKHFPGHGATDKDSHHAVAVLEGTSATLRTTHMAPFKTIAPASPMMMIGHLIVKDVDPDLPATLSPKVVKQLLVGEQGYTGVVISDDLLMDAARFVFDSSYNWVFDSNKAHVERSVSDVVALGLEAGLDIFLSQNRWPEIYAALVALGNASTTTAARLKTSADKIRALKQTILAYTPPTDLVAQLTALVDAHKPVVAGI